MNWITSKIDLLDDQTAETKLDEFDKEFENVYKN